MSVEDLQQTVVPGDRTAVKELLSQRYNIQLDDKPQEAEQNRQPQAGDLDGLSLELLISINRHPCLRQTERVQSLDAEWSGSKMNRRKEKLKERGLIEERSVETGSGATANYHLLTDAGRQLIKDLGMKPQTLHGSLEHHCYIVWLAESYEENYKTQIDTEWKGYRPDILCKGRKQQETGVVEVMYTMHTTTDLQKLHELAERADWIHVYCVKDADSDHLSQQINEQFVEEVADKIDVRTAA